MNNNNHVKKPVFQQANQKKFNERTVGERSEKNRPHSKARLEHSSERKSPKALAGSHFKTKEKPSRRMERTEQRVTETTMRTASGESGKVKVIIKSTGVSDEPYEKKTGPLSPRAPEKIKKNRAEEMKVYGENACAALFLQRPESIVRIWATVEIAKKNGELLSYLAANKKVYHVVDNAELTLVSGTEHHGGICMLVKKARPLTLSGYLDIPRQRDCLVMIDGVQNAHNLGGVIRTCAVFGVKGAIVDSQFAEHLNSSAAMRVAEGGMEYIRVLETNSIENALVQLRQVGYQVIHLSTNKQAKALNDMSFSHKVVFVVNETGNSTLADKEDDKVILSLGNPLKAELNIAVATGILLAQWTYQLN